MPPVPHGEEFGRESELHPQTNPAAGSRNLDNFDFLLRTHIDAETLKRARTISEGWNVPVHMTLLSLGWIGVEDYLQRLATALNIPPIHDAKSSQETNGQTIVQIDATLEPPAAVAARVRQAQSDGHVVRLNSYLKPDLAGADKRRAGVRRATHTLRRTQPSQSADRSPPLWLLTCTIAATGFFAGATLVDPPLAYFVVACVAAIPFFFIVCQRLLALLVLLFWPAPSLIVPRHTTAMGDLPVYTLLVPLYDEAEILPDLVDALIRLDYPAAKLDVILVLEETDHKTRDAAEAAGLPGFIRVLTTPPYGPRTKPKALNFALDYARGEFVTIFDAEDIPEPQQLRRALAVFKNYPDLECLQARLNIYNRGESWLAGQFALEYTALFDGLLPALERLGVPLPLGGTSNHFRTSTLLAAGRWDSHNVTEDADLGIQLKRRGAGIAVLPSTTWEEAPATLSTWLPQRTRWLKGWMQTYMVHMRRPFSLLRDLGLWRFLGFQCLIFGFLLLALLHPFFYVIIALELSGPTPFASGQSTLEVGLWYIALFNLFAGYLSAVLFATITALRRGWPLLALSAIWMPIYWLLSSIAAYRALWQLFANPHLWEKTRHTPRRGLTPNL